MAAALSDPVDHQAGVRCVPTLQELAAANAQALGEMDYLKAATDFADCMLAYGRDRYGTVHSPLFAVLLTRVREPTIGPQPFFVVRPFARRTHPTRPKDCRSALPTAGHLV